MTTIFETNGEYYSINIQLVDGIGQTVSLDNDCIGKFEYINRLNNLYLKGKLEYTDQDAKIDRFLKDQNVKCEVTISRYEDQNGDILKCSNTMDFFVDNIGVEENEPGKIKYNIVLIGNNWINYEKNIFFSNYNKTKEPIFDIIKQFLKEAEMEVDQRTFENSPCGIKINYITNGNDTIATAINYLLNKLYFSEYYGLDNGLKALVFDEYEKNMKLYDATLNSTFTNSFTTEINQVKNEQGTTENENVNIAFVMRKTRHESVKSTAGHRIHKYSLKDNNFDYEDISQKKIHDYICRDENIDEVKYIHQSPFWNNDIDIYNRQMESLVDNNSMIINIFGKMGLTPGCGMNLKVNVDDIFSLNDSKQISKANDMKYDNIGGAWIVSQVRTFVNPQKKLFRQNVSLIRNKGLH